VPFDSAPSSIPQRRRWASTSNQNIAAYKDGMRIGNEEYLRPRMHRIRMHFEGTRVRQRLFGWPGHAQKAQSAGLRPGRDPRATRLSGPTQAHPKAAPKIWASGHVNQGSGLQNPFVSLLIRWIGSRRPLSIFGRPTLFREFQRQNTLKPARCHLRMVSG
jgi:hypothetical protein